MDTALLRARARENLAGNWGLSVAVAAVAYLLSGLLFGLSFLPEFTYSFGGESRTLAQWFSHFTTLTYEYGRSTVSFNPLRLAGFVLGGVIQLGYTRFLLKQYRRQDFRFNDLFSEFDRFGTGFAQKFLRSLYSFLWGLLFVIPGIIATYRYAMTPFLLSERPELTASQAIQRSKEMMEGHKWELFVLDLSFLGWDILASLTLGIGHLWLNPYKNAARAAFYRELTAVE